MGYSSSGGPDGLGVFNNSPSTTADFNQLVALIALMGNTQKGVQADRDAIAGGQLYDGLLFTYTDKVQIDVYMGGWQTLIHDWVTYTPTATNISGGTLTARYRRIGKQIEGELRHVLAGAGISGQPSYTLPVTAADGNVQHIGTGMLQDASPLTEYSAVVRKSSTTIIAPYAWAASLAYLQFVNVSATTPFTWANADVIDMKFSYRAA